MDDIDSDDHDQEVIIIPIKDMTRDLSPSGLGYRTEMGLKLSKLTSPTMAMLFVRFVPPLWNQWNILKDTWSQCTVRLVFTVLNVEFQRLLESSCKVIKDLTKLMSVLIVAKFYHSEMVWMKTYSTSYFTLEKSQQTSCWVRTVISGSDYAKCIRTWQ